MRIKNDTTLQSNSSNDITLLKEYTGLYVTVADVQIF